VGVIFTHFLPKFSKSQFSDSDFSLDPLWEVLILPYKYYLFNEELIHLVVNKVFDKFTGQLKLNISLSFLGFMKTIKSNGIHGINI